MHNQLPEVNLNEIKQYMFYSSNSNAETISNNSNSNSKDNDENKVTTRSINKKFETKVPRSLVQINYSKKYSKYNEPYKIKDDHRFKDKLFWTFYKLLYDYRDDDLEKINAFTIEKEFKFKIIDKIREQKQLFKSHKIQKNALEDDLINSKTISLRSFQALCLLHSMNLVLIKDNKTYTTFCYDALNPVINIDNFKIIKLIYNIGKDGGYANSQISNRFNVEILDRNYISEEELQTILKTYYYLDNIEKPLKAFSGYKLDEIVDIAKKLDIVIYNEHGKSKRKKDLYEEILKILS